MGRWLSMLDVVHYVAIQTMFYLLLKSTLTFQLANDWLPLFPHNMLIVLMTLPQSGMTSPSHPAPRKNQSRASAAFLSLAPSP
jgi:hypothetical protein